MYIAARLDLLRKFPGCHTEYIEILSSYQNNELINLLIPDESEVLSALPEKPVNNNLNLLFSHGSAQCWQSISHLLENNQLPHNT